MDWKQLVLVTCVTGPLYLWRAVIVGGSLAGGEMQNLVLWFCWLSVYCLFLLWLT